MIHLHLNDKEEFVLNSILDDIYLRSNIYDFSTDLTCYLYFTEDNFKVLSNIRDKFNNINL